MFGRKGQGAMEYLMTYGWAILVVMVVGIVMWQLGIFNLGGTSLTATGFAKIKPQLSGSGIRSNGQFWGVFTNGVGTTIALNGGNINCTTGCQGCTLVFTPATVAAGENFAVNTTGVQTCVTAGNPGDVYTALASLSYNVTIGTVTTTHIESGSLRGPME